jgi:hypothetical protein
MKSAVFWDIKAELVPYRRHYFSATDPKLLMLCKICGDYEECRLVRCYVVWL